jgi:hypothetical protein
VTRKHFVCDMGNVCSACFGKRAVSNDPAETEPILKAPHPSTTARSGAEIGQAKAAEVATNTSAAPYQADAAPKTSAPVAIPVRPRVILAPKLLCP